MVIRSVFLRLAIMLVLLLVCSACFAQVKVNLAWDLSASDAMLGPTGGYNLQLCWSTGYLAGQSSAF